MNVTSVSFPYGESIQWFSPEIIHALPKKPLTEWLLANGSLTQRLKSHCQHFEVKVLGEHLQSPLADEWPNKQTNTQVWVREVLLCLDGEPWVFARTLIPQNLLTHNGNAFIHLGNRPLGELLFSSPSIIPGKIEIATFETCGQLALLAQSLNQPVNEPLWGRRRYFSIDDSQLIVSEIFLPKAVTFINQTNSD